MIVICSTASDPSGPRNKRIEMMQPMTNDDAAVERVHQRFLELLRAYDPAHPWVQKLPLVWREPRRVDGWWWYECEIVDGDGCMVRYGTISWNANGSSDVFDVMMTFQREGLGLPCWPSFRVLSDAQDFVERLMRMTVQDAQALHGKQWQELQ